jgi:glycosyltransferase involved in cell wall biosynthesis
LVKDFTQMRIVYDHQVFSWQKYGGISRYFCELAVRIASDSETTVQVFAPLYVNEYLRRVQQVPHLVRGMKVPQVPKTGRMMNLANRFLVRKWLGRSSPDVVHETYYSDRPLAPKSSKIVVTVYDMVHEKFNGGCLSADKTGSNKAMAVARADHVICISENTKKDLIELLDIRPEKISVIYLGYELECASPEKKSERTQEPYILYVGNRDRYKNFSRLLQVYASSAWLQSNFKLVCFGGPPFTGTELQEIRRLGIPQAYVVRMDGNDAALARLYAGAAAFVYPSLYEGFGLPLLEAMAYDCPVVCSDSSSIPEVVGQAGEYFDPTDVHSIAAALDKVLGSSEHASELIRKGRQQVKRFSWDKCAQNTLRVYRELL